jgi:hypothetical protein
LSFASPAALRSAQPAFCASIAKKVPVSAGFSDNPRMSLLCRKSARGVLRCAVLSIAAVGASVVSAFWVPLSLAQVRPDAGSTLQQPVPRVEPGETRRVLPQIAPVPQPAAADSSLRVFVKGFRFRACYEL